MVRIDLRQLGTTAVLIAAIVTIALIAPGAAFAQRTITIVIPEEPDSLDNCNSARSAVDWIFRFSLDIRSICVLAQSVASTSFAASFSGRSTFISRSYGWPATFPLSLMVPLAPRV